ncbi:hypothetical protein KDW63_04025 [Burkholderia cenocepacia]|uniref:hypothetical protein n=1 Tax=Burkholderia cenocepacia TaxID=95486 RepID=UPI001177C35A|nr:hypothetical protein [Burkholderia cenocepacia]MBR8079173.1 hypothetical protein [Burkholderia cenocepacia]MBR8293348.1 hypothetical protein [Burkholderia cenocepacia]
MSASRDGVIEKPELVADRIEFVTGPTTSWRRCDLLSIRRLSTVRQGLRGFVGSDAICELIMASAARIAYLRYARIAISP